MTGKKIKSSTSVDLPEGAFRQIVDAAPQFVYMKNLDNRLVYVNESYARHLGVPIEDAIGKTDFDLHPEPIAKRRSVEDMTVMKSSQGISVVRDYAEQGERYILSGTKSLLVDQAGRPWGMVAIFNDVAQFKLAEEAAARRGRVLEGINRIFRIALQGETERTIMANCLEVCEEITDSQFGFVGEVNAANRLDTLAISNPGWEACRIPETNATRLISNMEIRGLWARPILTGKGFYTNDPMNHPDSCGVPSEHPPLTAYLGVPMKEEGRSFGVISMGNKPGGYDDGDLEAIESLSVAMVEALRRRRTEQQVAAQAQEILEISTPVVKLWDGIVAAPLIGTLDSQRTNRFMQQFLWAIADSQSPIAIIDITGVPTVDTQTAQHLIECSTATRLLGAEVILTGISPRIAQTLIQLGMELSELKTCATLASGLELALQRLNLRVVSTTERKKS